MAAASGHPELVIVDENGNEHYWYLAEPGTPEIGREGGTPTLDSLGFGRLEAPWAETFTVGVERELWPETSIELEYVRKKTRDLIEDVGTTHTWHWDPSVPEPGYGDPGIWEAQTVDDGRIFANVANAGRDFEALIAKLETRHERYYLKGSYTWSRSRGGSSTESWFGYQSTAFDYYPANYYNTYGYMSDDRRHVVKLSGYALLPWDLTLSLAYAWASPPAIDTLAECPDVTPALLDDGGYDPQFFSYCYEGELERQWAIFLEPRGSRRGRASYNIDLGIAKAFHLGPTTFEVNLAVLNAWGAERPDEYNEQEFRSDGLAVGAPTSYTEPRRYQVGVRMEF